MPFSMSPWTSKYIYIRTFFRTSCLCFPRCVSTHMYIYVSLCLVRNCCVFLYVMQSYLFSEKVGRIVIELADDILPITSKNFALLCQGKVSLGWDVCISVCINVLTIFMILSLVHLILLLLDGCVYTHTEG